MTKKNPMDILNKVREKAKLNNEDFSKSIAIKLKAGKIKFQLIAKDDEHLFRARTQHVIPKLPNEDDVNEKWMVADCKGEGCPVCAAINAFKNSGVTVEEVNEAYTPKFPYKNLRSVFTQNEHYLLFAKILSDQADDGNYLPKDSEIGSTHLIQLPRIALNNLMSAYEDAIDDAEGEEIPPLFAIFNDDKTAESLTVTARITNQPYSCNFSFGKVVEVSIDDVDKDCMGLLETPKEVPAEHYENCVKRIKKIQNYFVKSSATNNATEEDDIPFSMSDSNEKPTKVHTTNVDDDLNLDELMDDIL